MIHCLAISKNSSRALPGGRLSAICVHLTACSRQIFGLGIACSSLMEGTRRLREADGEGRPVRPLDSGRREAQIILRQGDGLIAQVSESVRNICSQKSIETEPFPLLRSSICSQSAKMP